ncbi:nucleotidyltransferase substrate binding protein [Thermodesulfatator autotrophicus]|uniref:Nucleotidyltransferase n=1 Tax=Thermodesulfatator autotrophicus TaxID=1795632 RepID=A0A177E612_9BACT|nr:nucleotidyltransferase substrate binding protein [Thermodesulfatator autotrophicus]OAG26931.1 nucleotidyltransferase [Thermodesulfatator autotrophicus]
MKKTDLYLAIDKLEQAFARLKEALPKVKDDLDRDGVIQRFEFTVELFWKTLKIILAYQGIECASPRRCIKEAFRAGLIDDDEIVLDMLEDRNRSSHIYDESTAEEIFMRITKVYCSVLEKLITKIKKRAL